MQVDFPALEKSDCGCALIPALLLCVRDYVAPADVFVPQRLLRDSPRGALLPAAVMCATSLAAACVLGLRNGHCALLREGAAPCFFTARMLDADEGVLHAVTLSHDVFATATNRVVQVWQLEQQTDTWMCFTESGVEIVDLRRCCCSEPSGPHLAITLKLGHGRARVQTATT